MASILPLRHETRQNTDHREHVLEAALAPTMNGVTPYAGIKNCQWILGEFKKLLESKCMEHLASEIITSPRVTYRNYFTF